MYYEEVVGMHNDNKHFGTSAFLLSPSWLPQASKCSALTATQNHNSTESFSALIPLMSCEELEDFSGSGT